MEERAEKSRRAESCISTQINLSEKENDFHGPALIFLQNITRTRRVTLPTRQHIRCSHCPGARRPATCRQRKRKLACQARVWLARWTHVMTFQKYLRLLQEDQPVARPCLGRPEHLWLQLNGAESCDTCAGVWAGYVRSNAGYSKSPSHWITSAVSLKWWTAQQWHAWLGLNFHQGLNLLSDNECHQGYVHYFFSILFFWVRFFFFFFLYSAWTGVSVRGGEVRWQSGATGGLQSLLLLKCMCGLPRLVLWLVSNSIK